VKENAAFIHKLLDNHQFMKQINENSLLKSEVPSHAGAEITAVTSVQMDIRRGAVLI
jgi:hypothetical protein